MRLNLYWRGRDVIDIEAHLWRRREEGDPEPPSLTAAPHLAASEIADPMEAPDCTAHTFGFGRST